MKRGFFAAILGAAAMVGRNITSTILDEPVATVFGAKGNRSKYDPHQGKRECERRIRNIARGLENAAPYSI